MAEISINRSRSDSVQAVCLKMNEALRAAEPQELNPPNEIWLQLGHGDEGQHSWCDHETEWEPQVKYTRCAAEPVDAGELDGAIEYLSKYENGWSGSYGCAVEMVYHAAKAHRASLSNVTYDGLQPIDAAKFMLKNCVSWLSTNGYRDAALQIIDLPLPNFDKIPTQAKGEV